MKTYTVILIRDPLRELNEDKTLQHLQYAAGPFEAEDEFKAAEMAIRELQSIDAKFGSEVDSKNPIILGGV